MIVVGAFLPWVSVEFLGVTESKIGVEGDGIFTLLFGLVIIGLVFYSMYASWGRISWTAVLILGALTALLAIAYVNDPWLGADNRPVGPMESWIDVGSGLYVTATGGIVSVIGPLVDKFG